MEPESLSRSDHPRPIALRLETDDLQVAFDLLSTNTALQVGVELAAPGGATVRLRNLARKGPAAPRGWMDFELLHAAPASVDTLASWLYRCLQHRLPEVRIGRSTVPVELGSLRKALEAAIASSVAER